MKTKLNQNEIRQLIFPGFCAIFRQEIARARTWMPDWQVDKRLGSFTIGDIPQSVIDEFEEGFGASEHILDLMREYFRNRFGFNKPFRMKRRLSARPRQ